MALFTVGTGCQLVGLRGHSRDSFSSLASHPPVGKTGLLQLAFPGAHSKKAKAEPLLLPWSVGYRKSKSSWDSISRKTDSTSWSEKLTMFYLPPLTDEGSYFLQMSVLIFLLQENITLSHWIWSDSPLHAFKSFWIFFFLVAFISFYKQIFICVVIWWYRDSLRNCDLHEGRDSIWVLSVYHKARPKVTIR